jgi:hypothetical protein
VEYYLVYFVSKEQLGSYAEAESFKSALEAFRQKRSDWPDLDKNTSLIICVAMDAFQTDSAALKYDILRIEEDEFLFKKYVLSYTQAAVSAFALDEHLIELLDARISNTDSFERYFTNPFEDEAYFLAMQLFLKLPILGAVPTELSTFRSIQHIIDQYLSADDIRPYYEMVKSDQFAELDWDALQRDALDPNSTAFDAFFFKKDK